jgi:hypothetical protein
MWAWFCHGTAGCVSRRPDRSAVIAGLSILLTPSHPVVSVRDLYIDKRSSCYLSTQVRNLSTQYGPSPSRGLTSYLTTLAEDASGISTLRRLDGPTAFGT